jgi:hypothetical protein
MKLKLINKFIQNHFFIILWYTNPLPDILSPKPLVRLGFLILALGEIQH